MNLRCKLPAAIAGSRHNLRLPSAILGAGLVVLLVAGCGGGGGSTSSASTSPAGPGTKAATAGVYVASVPPTKAAIALVTDGSRLTGGFLCIPHGGTSWIKPAPFANGAAALDARNGTHLGTASFADKSATGQVTVEGASRSFTAKLASGKAGLYRTVKGTGGKPGYAETGWIVQPSGQVCAVTNSIASDGSFRSEPTKASPKGKITNFEVPFSY